MGDLSINFNEKLDRVLEEAERLPTCKPKRLTNKLAREIARLYNRGFTNYQIWRKVRDYPGLTERDEPGVNLPIPRQLIDLAVEQIKKSGKNAWFSGGDAATEINLAIGGCGNEPEHPLRQRAKYYW